MAGKIGRAAPTRHGWVKRHEVEAGLVLKACIDQHRDAYEVEPICKALQTAPSRHWHHPALHELRKQRANEAATVA